MLMRGPNIRLLLCVIACMVLASCQSSTTTYNGGTPPTTCIFHRDTLIEDFSDSGKSFLFLIPESDSAATYSAIAANTSIDSLVPSLCAQGFGIKTAYYDLNYFCKDMMGPRVVVVLTAPNSAILRQNFSPGNQGRFTCATQILRYRPGN